MILIKQPKDSICLAYEVQIEESSIAPVFNSTYSTAQIIDLADYFVLRHRDDDGKAEGVCNFKISSMGDEEGSVGGCMKFENFNSDSFYKNNGTLIYNTANGTYNVSCPINPCSTEVFYQLEYKNGTTSCNSAISKKTQSENIDKSTSLMEFELTDATPYISETSNDIPTPTSSMTNIVPTTSIEPTREIIDIASKNALSTGAIIGIAFSVLFGVTALLAVTGVAIFCFINMRQKGGSTFYKNQSIREGNGEVIFSLESSKKYTH